MDEHRIDLDYLVHAYFRFKEWIGYDLVRSSYCVKELAILQDLFGTSYLEIPSEYATLSYEEVVSRMRASESLWDQYKEAIYGSGDDDLVAELDEKVRRAIFRSRLPELQTLQEVVMRAADTATIANGPASGEEVTFDAEEIEDFFDGINEKGFDVVHAKILADHPGIELLSFAASRLRELGLPNRPPDIEHGPCNAT